MLGVPRYDRVQCSLLTGAVRAELVLVLCGAVETALKRPAMQAWRRCCPLLRRGLEADDEGETPLTPPDFDVRLDADRAAHFSVKQGLAAQIYGPEAEGALAMWVADMDLPCCERIRRALAKRCEHPTFGYTFVPSAAWQHAARWLGEQQGWEHPLAEDNFVFSPSVVTSFYNIVQAFTSPSDGVLVFTPLYRPLQQVVEGSKRKLVCQSLGLESGQYRLDRAALEAQLPLVRLVLLCNPQNPSGRAWRRDELDALAFACARHNVLVVSDEIHADWCLWGHKHSPFSNSAKETCCSHITLNAPTKTWNLAGLHCSYLVFVDMYLKQRYIDAVFHGHLTFNNVFASVALLTAYSEGLPWLCAAKAYIEDNISWLEHFLRWHIPEIVVLRPEATFLVWMDCTGLGLGADELDTFMLSEARVILSSGREFSAETSLYQRLNCGCSRGKLKEAARRLERAVHGLRSMRSKRFPGAPNLARDHLLL